jgi:SulP family sulfate permease
MIAELPPNVGLYAAIVTSIVGALWGSSNHLSLGPTNTSSLVVLATLLPIASVGNDQYILAAGLMAVMVGVFQIVLGVSRMGVLVNFVSDSVIIGLTAGAGVLIGANQLRHLLRLDFPSSSSLIITVREITAHITDIHWVSLIIGIIVVLVIVLMKRFKPKWPGPLIGMVLAAVIVGSFHLDQRGIAVIGQLPRNLPPIADLPLLDFELISQLSSGALAIGMMSLVEAVAISRSIASQSGQHLDSNQEFIGLGLSNMISGFFSGYAVSGSFTRTAVNYNAGARTSFSSIFSGIFVLITMLVIAPLAAYLPRTSLAGVLLVTAYSMIDRKEIVRILRGTRGDSTIMIMTFLATLLLPLQFAVLTGIMMSLAIYITRTSVPRVVSVQPAKNFSHFTHLPYARHCTQLAILDILGDLYFGAVSHVEESIRAHLREHPTQRFLLLRMFSVNQIDISGVHALESIVRTMRQRGGDVFLMRTQEPVMAIFKSTGFFDTLGEDHFLSFGDAIGYVFHRVLDPTICIYECEARVFKECQNLPKQHLPKGEITLRLGIPVEDVPGISPIYLWGELHGKILPTVIDVREPREFKRGHIPHAQSIPLFKLLADPSQIPDDQPVIFVCRGGRRSTRATSLFIQKGYDNIRVLEGGMLAWENDGLLEAID